MYETLRVPNSESYCGLTVPIAVMLEQPEATQRHMGLIAELFPGEHWLIEHGSHRDTRAAEFSTTSRTQCWLPVRLEEDVAEQLAEVARIVRDKYTGRDRGLPYSIRYKGGGIRRTGPGSLWFDEYGFTCATFVVALFRGQGFDVIDLMTWTPRGDDELWQRSMVDRIRGRSVRQQRQEDTEHADRDASAIPCLRYRPEEVVAALAIGQGRAVSFEQAEPVACGFLALLPAPSSP